MMVLMRDKTTGAYTRDRTTGALIRGSVGDPCCCGSVLPCAGYPPHLTLTIAGVNASPCSNCFELTVTTLDYQVQSISVDGVYLLPAIGPVGGGCQYGAQFSGAFGRLPQFTSLPGPHCVTPLNPTPVVIPEISISVVIAKSGSTYVQTGAGVGWAVTWPLFSDHIVLQGSFLQLISTGPLGNPIGPGVACGVTGQSGVAPLYEASLQINSGGTGIISL